ncbi:hypothetical protein BGZ98_008647 [Dissophora globulifera]|nr:hypothetical protein BGZ98_008647 [Dissophora globulifera]
MSSVDLPSIQTNFSPYSATVASPSSTRSYHASSSTPSSPAPHMNFQNRSFSVPSLSLRLSSSSLHSQYSASSDRSLSCSPGPATPNDIMSRSPSFSHERAQKSLKHHMAAPFSPVLPQPKGYTTGHSSLLQHHHHHHHPYQQQQPQPQHPHHQHHHAQPFASIPHPSTVSRQQQPSHALPHAHHQQYHGQALPSPRDVYPSSPKNHTDPQHYHHSSQPQHPHHHRESHYHARPERSSYCGPTDYFSRPTSMSSYHHHLATPTTPTAMDSISSRLHSQSPAPLTPLHISTRSIHPTSVSSPSPYSSSSSPPSAATPTTSTTTTAVSAHGISSGRMIMMDEDYKHPMSRSPSIASDRSAFSPEPSPFLSEQHFMRGGSSSSMSSTSSGMNSPASTSMSSLSALLSSHNSSSLSLSSSNNGSSGHGSSSLANQQQLLLCPVCSRAFKPSKNQNCNLRRHLKNVHNMSPTMHPRKCKWDSLPDGRVKDDKDRKERTRKSKRLWARKFRLRRKVEEAAVVLSMLSQAQ